MILEHRSFFSARDFVKYFEHSAWHFRVDKYMLKERKKKGRKGWREESREGRKLQRVRHDRGARFGDILSCPILC